MGREDSAFVRVATACVSVPRLGEHGERLGPPAVAVLSGGMRRVIVLSCVLLGLTACGRPPSRGAASASSSAAGSCETGEATYYADSLAGRRTASGEPYDPRAMTAAHRSMPFGSWVRVAYGEREVAVRVTDRGPFRGGGVIDLSREAASQLGMVRAGRVPVRVCPM